ncbi:Radical SAM domain protein [Thermoanaerobacter mathranii subsp. mathranii str. A3]|uniref:Radical SAM domain protein n=1 Tax=Thermoanaerobacter mathranii subsp. mathranii (strain DSM 11426 / CCUG 53645 / CIP 108742 / A3) TaxID=583358 RepID=A0ABM5LN72_THEM3|nr:SPASM domain-containing protein [Thermoanaerobacter mathranii]ADH60220.1 Radical SAM domain protein [Thermoanaerobacter mathranii subsp. mathranii str. A3]
MFKSKYIHECFINSKLLLFHTLTFSYEILTGEDIVLWEKNKFDFISNKKLGKLISKLFIVEDKGSDEALLNKAITLLGNKGRLKPQFFIYVTTECNLNCPYCYQRDYKSKNITISKKHVDSVVTTIDLLSKKENKHLVIFGGEPLLPQNKQIIEYMFDRFKTIDATVEIVTNGIYLKQYDDVLSSNKQMIKILRFTLNGPKKIHNFIRDNSNFDTFSIITDNIRYVLNKYDHIQVIINFLLDKLNCDSISDLFNELEINDILGKQNCRIEFGRIQSRKHPENNFYKNELPYTEYYPVLLRTKLKDKRITDEMLIGSEVSILGKIYRQFLKKEIAIPNLKGCKAIYPGVFAFYPDGKIYPCDEIAGDVSYAIGQYYPYFMFYKEKENWSSYSVLDNEKCLKCKFIGMCNGGCLVSNLAVNGDINSPYCLDIENSLNNFLVELELEGFFNGQDYS